jgi:predicted Fe-Mo cluster-binding NifX family protein
MNVAITIWENRISPVFDSAETLLIAEVRAEQIVARKVRLFQAGMFDRFVQMLLDLEVRVLICGALCAGPAGILELQGIHVISFVAGDAEKVLEFYVRGSDLAEFAMPGCRSRRCCRARGAKSED